MDSPHHFLNFVPFLSIGDILPFSRACLADYSNLLIYVPTKTMCLDVMSMICKDQPGWQSTVNIDVVHGDSMPGHRKKVTTKFSSGQLKIVVATSA